MVTISPGQALLLLYDFYKEQNLEIAERLKVLYLSGPKTIDDRAFLDDCFSHSALAKYDLSLFSAAIDGDESRRYFETHLAYETLREKISDIDEVRLFQHVEMLKSVLPRNKLAIYLPILEASYDVGYLDGVDLIFKEYGDYIYKIKNKKIFADFSDEARRKILLLVQSSFLGVACGWNLHNEMPLDVYDSGLFSAENRGKYMIELEDGIESQNLGLMRSYMPLPADDIARSATTITFFKPSDQARYDASASWVVDNFSRLFHPFSNSISGTMLVQLRVNAYLMEQGRNQFIGSTEDIATFSALLISAMLFYSGGHTIYEFVAPLMQPGVREYFSDLAGFSSLGLEDLFLHANSDSYQKAFEDAIDYNKIILRKKEMHQGLFQHLNVTEKGASVSKRLQNFPKQKQ